MVSKATINRRQNARWDGRWFRNDPMRGVPGMSACFDCKAFTPWTTTMCAYKNCSETWCGKCGHYEGGAGPIGCPCDNYGNLSGGKGHHTKDEQVGVHYRLSENPNAWKEGVEGDEFWTPFILTPIKKRKPSKRRVR